MSIEHPLFDRMCDEWEWCWHCEHAAAASEWSRAGWECPWCGADARDMWPWSEVRAANPSLPETPLPDVLYRPSGRSADEPLVMTVRRFRAGRAAVHQGGQAEEG